MKKGEKMKENLVLNTERDTASCRSPPSAWSRPVCVCVCVEERRDTRNKTFVSVVFAVAPFHPRFPPSFPPPPSLFPSPPAFSPAPASSEPTTADRQGRKKRKNTRFESARPLTGWLAGRPCRAFFFFFAYYTCSFPRPPARFAFMSCLRVFCYLLKNDYVSPL